MDRHELKDRVERWIERSYIRMIYLPKLLSDKQLMIVLAIVVGLVAGFATYLFEELLHGIKHVLVSWFPEHEAGYLFLVYPVIGIILATLFVKYWVKDNISEGVTRVLYAMSKRGSMLRPHNTYSSMVGGAITIGFGGSVGPEAPLVLTGAAIGSNIGRIMRMNYRHITLLLGCGAAAALSGVFKAPITGVVFVLEILMIDITTSSIISLLISSVTAVSLMFFLTDFEPVLKIDVSNSFALKNLPLYMTLGVICGMLSFYFKSVNSKIAAWFGGMKKQYSKWVWGGIILGILIFVFPPLYGEGYSGFIALMNGDTDALFRNSLFYQWKDIPWVIIAYLLATLFFKVIAMAATNASGGVGGTFAPSLFVGAFAGGSMAYICNTVFGLDLPIVSFTLVGMAGVMAGVMNAPLTSIFLIAELSNGYGLFVPLMLASSIAFAVGYYFDPHSVYTKKLAQSGELLTHNKDKSVLVFLDLSKLMERDFHPIRLDSTLGDLVDLISNIRRNIFPVVNDEGQLLGVVQLDDLRADMFIPEKYGTTIDRYMIPPPDTIMQNEQVNSVLTRFEKSKAWMLPVVDKHGVYLGFISKSRILAAYRDQLIAISEE